MLSNVCAGLGRLLKKVDDISDCCDPTHRCRREVELTFELVFNPQCDLGEIQAAKANFRDGCVVVPCRLFALSCQDLVYEVEYLLSFHDEPLQWFGRSRADAKIFRW